MERAREGRDPRVGERQVRKRWRRSVWKGDGDEEVAREEIGRCGGATRVEVKKGRVREKYREVKKGRGRGGSGEGRGNDSEGGSRE